MNAKQAIPTESPSHGPDDIVGGVAPVDAHDAGPDMSSTDATMVAKVPICDLDLDAIAGRVDRWVAEGSQRYICVCRADAVVSASVNASSRWALLHADLNIAEGRLVAWPHRILAESRVRRCRSLALLLRVLHRAEQRGWRVAIGSGTPNQIAIIREMLMLRFPELNVVAAFSESALLSSHRAAIDDLTEAEPQLTIVGMESPFQERWLCDQVRVVPGVMMGLGDALLRHANLIKTTPVLLQHVGLGWAHRLLTDRGAQWRRYVRTAWVYPRLVGEQLFESIATDTNNHVRIRHEVRLRGTEQNEHTRAA